ncbi:MAG TPA: hypothetical protein DD435_15475 [Cyanobacteria bacterium UBA8530]|nr:hypothetical protein [Cyanobacteria bacterium UBA8530]
MKQQRLLGPFPLFQDEVYFPAIGELEGIPNQVEEDLAQSIGIPFQFLGKFGRDRDGKLELLLVGANREDVEHSVQGFLQGEAMGIEFQLLGLDLGEIEDVVDDL